MGRTRNLLSNVREIDHYGNGGLMIWACITLNMAAHTSMSFWLEFYFNGWQQKTHRAHLVDDFLESEDIRRMDWPIRSPEIIRIEHA
ncbi:hypothetical protein TNCV_4061291 [Trichonephila clavipes]|nr:hypothetical protein TNCV_4061291 [Trichonephila clavipes]